MREVGYEWLHGRSIAGGSKMPSIPLCLKGGRAK